MRDWPPITEPELLERLALDDDRFLELVRVLSSAWGAREFQRSTFEWALGYPFERPAASYILRGAHVELLEAVEPAKRPSTVEALTADRHPMLSYGGNAAPSWLTAKFAHFPDEADRTVLVLTGRLEDFDVGPAAAIAPTGYMPATLFASPGTRVRASIVWATDAQATQLTWSEIPYRLVRLDDARFVLDDADVEIDAVFGYLHRLGSFCIDASPVAMAAIPADDRTAVALTQQELLDIAAGLVIGPDARAEALVRAVFEDMGAVTARAAETVWPHALHLRSGCTPFPAVTRD